MLYITSGEKYSTAVSSVVMSCLSMYRRSQVLSPDTVTPDNDVGLELKNLSIAPPHQSTPLIEGQG